MVSFLPTINPLRQPRKKLHKQQMRLPSLTSIGELCFTFHDDGEADLGLADLEIDLELALTLTLRLRLLLLE